MIDVSLEQQPAIESTEAYKELMHRVGKRSTKIPAELLVPDVLEMVPAQEWAVRVEALDALLRRLEAIKRDELRIDTRPGQGQVLGAYTTRRRGAGARPYQTVVSSIDPIDARCDCPDFVKNS